MKITKLAIVFVLIVLCCAISIDIRFNNLIAMNNKKMEYTQALDTAVDDAVLSLIDMDNSKTMTYSLNKNECMKQFFKSLYCNFGIVNDPAEQKKLMSYIPVIAVTDKDGFYISYMDRYIKDSSMLGTRVWSEKIPYSYTFNNLIYNFTFSNYLKVYEINTHAVIEGYYDDIKDHFTSEDIFQDKDMFDQIRKATIIDCIQNKMKLYINNYNRIADNFGITYNFYLPAVNSSDWQRTIDSISLFVVFQGYPYGYGTEDVFNRYSYAGARVKKANMYFITEESGRKYYHRADCDKVSDFSTPYFSKKECAIQGAFPCEKCIP